MKNTELRIGNYINTINRGSEVHLPDDIVFIIQKLGSKCELCRIDKKPWEEIKLPEIPYYDLSPIPLTEEWLLKFGFEWKIQHQGFYNGRFKIDEKYKEGYRLYFGGEKIDVKHVHQLQNLYFALTGEELKTT